MKLSVYNVRLRIATILLASLSIVHAEIRSRADLPTTPPADSAEAERVRIWVPIHRQSRCRVTVDILNDSNSVVCHLADRLMSQGYYNFYWDKKDDSGEFVRPGEYVFVVNDCGRKSYGEVTAQFQEWERAGRIYPPEEKWSTNVGFELLVDSAVVSVNIYNRRGGLVDNPIVDSLMNRGKYKFEWLPLEKVPRGIYTLKLTVGDFTHAVEIGYRP